MGFFSELTKSRADYQEQWMKESIGKITSELLMEICHQVAKNTGDYEPLISFLECHKIKVINLDTFKETAGMYHNFIQIFKDGELEYAKFF